MIFRDMEVAMNGNKPLGKKKTLQLLVLLTILAWATQTLIHQWGFGDTIDATPDATLDASNAPADVAPVPADAPAPDPVAPEKFVAGDQTDVPVVPPAATVELRSEATVVGEEVKFKQICRWSNPDQSTLAPIADLTLFRMSSAMPFRTITLAQIRQTLHDAGVNLATINFEGAASCTVTRADVQTDPQTALRQWIDSRQNAGATTQPSANQDSSNSPANVAPAAAIMPSSTPIAPAPEPAPDPKPFHTLRDLLTADICQRLSVAPDAIQLTFNPQDDKVLGLADVCFQFDIEPLRVRDLGAVSWEVTIFSGNQSKRVDIDARAQAWENQVIVAKPLAMREILTESDFQTRRTLVDTLPDQPLLTMAQCVGNAASDDLKPGQIMGARMVDPVPLVRAGQLVTVTLTDGSVQIRAVARAMEMGVLGQSIKVRSETTRDVFDVTVTGEQEARLGSTSASAGSAAADY
jgi:flagella basal body P-ring formation protein FlgA